MTLKTHFGTYEVKPVMAGRYTYNNAPRIDLICEDGEPFAVLTTCITSKIPIKGEEYSFVDTNNCPWAEKFIRENGLGEPTGFEGMSGYCIYPLYRFNLDKLK